MTKAEKEIIDLLKIYPAIRTSHNPFCSTYTINGRKVNEATLERMKGKCLIAIGIHPSSLDRTGFVVMPMPKDEETAQIAYCENCDADYFSFANCPQCGR